MVTIALIGVILLIVFKKVDVVKKALLPIMSTVLPRVDADQRSLKTPDTKLVCLPTDNIIVQVFGGIVLIVTVCLIGQIIWKVFSRGYK